MLLSILGLIMAKEVPVNRKPKSFSANESFLRDGGEYMTTVYMGTPLQKIDDMVMDTGSNLPWVKVEGKEWCANSTVCPGITPAFFPNSTTFSFEKSERCQLSYGTGSFNGFIAQDKFCFDSTGENCFSKPLIFGAAYNTTMMEK